MEKVILKSKGEESTEVLEVTKVRDAAYQKYLALSKKLLDACNSGSSLTGRIHERNKATRSRADCLSQLLDESVADQTQDPATATRSVVETLSLHDDWGVSKLEERLVVNQFRLFPERMKETWLANIARDYQSNVSPAIKRAAWVAISELHADSIRLDVLVTAAADAKTVVKDGARPHERMNRDLNEMISNIQKARRALRDAHLDINEVYLFHGTSSTSVRFICEHGFDERVANLNGLYGAGSYFASNSCKSHQYSNQYKDSPTWVMLVCRVVMGSPYCTSTQHNQQRRPPDNPATPGRPFDFIFAQHGVVVAASSSITSMWFSIAIRSTPNTLCNIQCKETCCQSVVCLNRVESVSLEIVTLWSLRARFYNNANNTVLSCLNYTCTRLQQQAVDAAAMPPSAGHLPPPTL